MADNFTIGLTFLAVILVLGLPTVRSYYTRCEGGTRYPKQCNSRASTHCCSSGLYSSAVCCSATSCLYAAGSYSTCLRTTDSKCCGWPGRGYMSCCNAHQYAITQCLYDTKCAIRGSNDTMPTGAIIGGVVGGLGFLGLVIAFALMVGMRAVPCWTEPDGRMQTTVMTQGAYVHVNQGYAPPVYGQTVQHSGQTQVGAPHALGPPQPGGQNAPVPEGQNPQPPAPVPVEQNPQPPTDPNMITWHQ